MERGVNALLVGLCSNGAHFRSSVLDILNHFACAHWRGKLCLCTLEGESQRHRGRDFVWSSFSNVLVVPLSCWCTTFLVCKIPGHFRSRCHAWGHPYCSGRQHQSHMLHRQLLAQRQQPLAAAVDQPTSTPRHSTAEARFHLLHFKPCLWQGAIVARQNTRAPLLRVYCRPCISPCSTGGTCRRATPGPMLLCCTHSRQVWFGSCRWPHKLMHAACLKRLCPTTRLPSCCAQRVVELQESWRIMVEFNTHGGAGQQYQDHKVHRCLECCHSSSRWRAARFVSSFQTPRSAVAGDL